MLFENRDVLVYIATMCSYSYKDLCAIHFLVRPTVIQETHGSGRFLILRQANSLAILLIFIGFTALCPIIML